jgi:copper oxidase (laccase) domain-containing protein
MQFETFPPLQRLPLITHAFTLRSPEDTRSPDYESRVAQHFGYRHFARAAQPHGGVAAVVTGPGHYPDADALITRQPGLPLLVRCADCAPVFLIDRKTPAIALIHCGKKGLAANIIPNTLKLIPDADLAFIGPSIGPCHYEIDLWREIEQQLAALAEVHNPRLCTACNLHRYYSYRAEHGQTGRLFALLALNPP